jgi:HK97 family phage major capsid protein
MPGIGELMQECKAAITRAESFVVAAENGKRAMTDDEMSKYTAEMDKVTKLRGTINQREKINTMRLFNPIETLMGRKAEQQDGIGDFLATMGGRARNVGMSGQRAWDSPVEEPAPRGFGDNSGRSFSRDYATAFFSYVASKGTRIDAALYEGSDGAGGYAVPIVVDSNIVPLSPPDMGVRLLASVIPTAMDIKIPQKGSFGVAGAKAESSTSTPTTFPETDPTLTQITLSAFMSGIRETISWELAQDVPAFQQFAVTDMLLAQQIYEETKYVSGSGNGEPQGLIGNTGTGVTAAVADAAGNLLSLDATFDVMGYLKGMYRANAAWLMQWSTGIALRKAQRQANLFEPVFTSVGGKDYLHGFPVEYSNSMPAIAAGATPVLFGDFKSGYVIGDRGGSGINVKVLDQPLAVQGQIILLAYRRSDGRVRRSEAIQAITLHASS